MPSLGTRFGGAESFVGKGTRSRAFAVALGLTLAGMIASLTAFTMVGPLLVGAFGEPLPDLVYKLRMRGSQVGFAGLSLAYLLVVRDWRRYVRFRRPGLADGAWVVAGTVGLKLAVELERVVLSSVGLSLATISGTAGRVVPLSSWPLLWPLVFAGLYLLPAMAEEQFFRGLVQTRLRGTYSAAAEVALAAALFSLAHQLYVVAGGAEMMATAAVHFFGQGLVFCIVYERSDNLLTVAAVHALSWTSAYGLLTGLLGM